MLQFTCGFIGLGLIGGSIAKALKASDPSIHIIAYDTNKNTLLQALQDKTVDIISDTIDERFGTCDYIFLCAPVSHNDENVVKLQKIISPATILTDVGSVKTPIHEHIAALGLSSQFIGGHPMAGSERTGYVNSKPLLLQNAYYILTPSEQTGYDKIMAYQNLVKKIGAIPLVLSYKEHDFVTAGISHLPHLIAATLVNLVKETDSEDGIMKLIAAGGFKDMTRIASSSPVMWEQICMTNCENIKRFLSLYISSLNEVQERLECNDEQSIYELFSGARTYRDSFISASSGPIKRIFDMTVEIADKPGALASIATLLASHTISIRNIGITHNREAAEGAMRIEFYDEDAMHRAEEILLQNHYQIMTV
ncbi:MAG TPA: prephenate dehydrogenase [Lachnospiraceae bacterium]|nr:prephenate dehydrogenase [Lachnospiraceae bacterium]